MAKSDQRRKRPSELSRPAPLAWQAEQDVPAADPASPPPMVWAHLWLHMVFLALIILSLTPYTYSLDDIKKSMYMGMGPLLMAMGLLSIWRGQAPPPPRIALIGLGGFGACLLVSTLLSRYKWVGWQESLAYWCGGGFLLSGMIIASRRITFEFFLKFLAAILLATNLVGFFLFDFFPSNPNINAPVEGFANWMYASRLVEIGSGTDVLLGTFSKPDSMGAMQSTILNRDFYAGFCTLYLPFAILLALAPGPGRQRAFWRSVGGLAALMSLICVVMCQSKGEYIFGALSLGIFLLALGFVADLPHLHGRVMAALLAGIATLVAALLWMLSPVILSRLKDLRLSVSSREIIWKGAWDIFKEFPILGGGPGTFRVYFPQFRATDYYEHEISNVTLSSHNLFLDQLCEVGAVGFICFMLILVPLFWTAGKRILKDPDPRLRILLLAAVCGLIAIFGSVLSSPSARWTIGSAQVWTVVGLTLGLTMRRPGEEQMEKEVLAAAQASPERRTWGRKVLPWLVIASAIPLFTGIHKGQRYFASQTRHLVGRQTQQAYDYYRSRGEDPAILTSQLLDAASQFESSIKIDANNYGSYYQLGSIYTDLANQARTDVMVASGRTGSPPDAQAALEANNRMVLYAKKAMDTYKRLEVIWPEYAELPYNLSLVYTMIAGLVEFETDAGLPQHFPDTIPQLWRERAMERAERMKKMSDKTDVANLLAQTYIRCGRPDLAVKVLREFTETRPTTGLQLENYAELLATYREAATYAKDPVAEGDALWKLWREDPSNDKLLDDTLKLANERRLDDLIARTTDALEKENPIDPRIARYRWEVAAAAGRADAAAAEFKRYIASDGRDGSVIARARAAAGPRAADIAAFAQARGIPLP